MGSCPVHGESRSEVVLKRTGGVKEGRARVVASRGIPQMEGTRSHRRPMGAQRSGRRAEPPSWLCSSGTSKCVEPAQSWASGQPAWKGRGR